ncbi:hypothetical protein [Streptomyces sp. NPDC046371]|uniref:hypothetical protein n=1 Tax=Streptomyces sp. NPDC046371 TaxID=3154916 RepID=UPI0033CC2312
MSLVGYWLVGLPAGYLLGVTADWGVQGVWTGQTIGLAATAALLLIALLRRVGQLLREKTGTGRAISRCRTPPPTATRAPPR